MRPDPDYTYDFMMPEDWDEMYAADEDAPDVHDEVLCCPDCERPNQFGELCPSCQREAAYD